MWGKLVREVTECGVLRGKTECLNTIEKAVAVFAFGGATSPSHLFTIQRTFQVHYQFTLPVCLQVCGYYFLFGADI